MTHGIDSEDIIMQWHAINLSEKNTGQVLHLIVINSSFVSLLMHYMYVSITLMPCLDHCLNTLGCKGIMRYWNL